MTDVAADEIEAPRKKSKLPLLLGVVLALAGGGGGFFAVSQGLLFGGAADSETHAADGGDHGAKGGETGGDGHGATVAALSFVPIEPLVISLSEDGQSRFLRFSAQVEVAPGAAEEVAEVMPRIVDVLNGYLRAVSLKELSDPGVLMRLRGQMLRRVQVVAGRDKVRDLLIMEFVLN